MFLKDNILALIGMNKDDEPRYFEKGEYVEARNVEISNTTEQGDRNIVRSIKSGLAYTLPSTGGLELGWQHLAVAKDIENNRTYKLSLVKFGAGDDDWYFVIYKQDLITNTHKIILQQLASTWGLYPWSEEHNQKIINPRIVDDNLVWTDNLNDIRMVDVDRMEATTDAGLTGTAVKWSGTTAADPGYAAGSFVWDKDKLYEVVQLTADNTPPADAPADYVERANINDVYLDVSNPDDFTLAALPPLIAPTADYVLDSTIKVNQLRGKTWQFSYRYIYMDYRKSTYAPPSLVPTPNKEEKLSGAPNSNPSHNNRIQVKVNTGSREVRAIEVIARSSSDPTTWFLIEEVIVVDNKGWRVYSPDTMLTVDFYNNKAPIVVDPLEVYTPFSYIPIRAKTMELIEGNRLVFANIAEGYPRIASDVSTELTWQSLSGIVTQTTPWDRGSHSEQDPIHPEDKVWQFQFILEGKAQNSGTFYIKIDKKDGEGLKEATYAYSDLDPYPETVKTGLQAAIGTAWDEPLEPAIVTCKGDDLPYKVCAFEIKQSADLPDPYLEWDIEFYFEESTITYVDKYPQLKTGVLHSWGIIYRDKAGRISPIVGSGEIDKYIPFAPESDDSKVGARPVVTFKINHTPPDWAESYEIVYGGNKSISWHLQLMGHNFSYGKVDHEDPSSPNDGQHYRLRIKSCQDKTRDFFNNWMVEEYEWQKGDRIRIIGTLGDNSEELTEIESIWDTEIVAVYPDIDPENHLGEGTTSEAYQAFWIYFKIDTDIALVPSEELTANNYWTDNLFVEIYRPAVVETGLFFTTGMTFPILTDPWGNKLHGGDTDQVLSSAGLSTDPATIANTSHDVWKYYRNFRNAKDTLTFKIWSESKYPSDFYETLKMTSQGNPIPDIESQQQNVLTKRARHGGIIGIGSQINNLADFEYDDYKDFKDEHGPIEGIYEVGFTLKVIQHSKETSVYISRQESYTASGDAQYLFTDKVFGSARPMENNWGSQHPDSICMFNRYLYYWDQREGVVIRSAANGQIDISRYKMKSYFADLAETMSGYTKENQRVEFIFSVNDNELLCMFGDNTATKEIITFSEDNQRWKRIIDMSVTFSRHYRFGRRLFTVNGDKTVEWDKGADYNNVVENVVRPEIQLHSIIQPAKVKVFNSIIVYSNVAERRFEFVDVSIPEIATAGEGAMKTNIYAANIKRRESAYYCQILNDINTPGTGTQASKEMNGREMRGLYLKAHIRNVATYPNSKFELVNVIVVSTPSERSS